MARTRAWFRTRHLMAAAQRPLSPPSPQSFHHYRLPSPAPILTRFFSTNLAVSEAYSSGFISGHQNSSQRHRLEAQDEEEVARYIPVKAYFLSTSIDLKSMQAENTGNVIPATSRSSNYVALRYSDLPPAVTGGISDLPSKCDTEKERKGTPTEFEAGSIWLCAGPFERKGKSMISDIQSKLISDTTDFFARNKIDLEHHLRFIRDIGIKENITCHRYVVAFQYGSAVLFNIADHEAEQYLDMVRKHATGLLPEMRKDDYAVVEKPMLLTWMQGGPDYIVLKSFDTDGIRIIGSVLGQSIALDHYIQQVDDMVQEFTDINRGMEKTGTFTMQRKKLFQLVGKANSNLADVIIKLGLFDRSEIAWKNANYAQILEYLREEYELTQRFGSLDFKLKFVEHNIHFLQEVLQNRRSDLLEWGVIILLSIEITISLYEIIKDSAIVPS